MQSFKKGRNISSIYKDVFVQKNARPHGTGGRRRVAWFLQENRQISSGFSGKRGLSKGVWRKNRARKIF